VKPQFAQHFSQDWLKEPVIWLDREGRMLESNYSASFLFGYTKEELLTKNIWDIDNQLFQSRWNKLWDEMLAQRFVKIQTKFRRKNESTVPVELYCQHYWLEGKDYMCAIVRDMTDIVSYQEQLWASQSKYEQLLKNLPLAMVVFGQDGKLFLANKTFEQCFGPLSIKVDWKEFLGENLFIKKKCDDLIKSLEPLFRSEVLTWGPELWSFKNSRGEKRQLELNINRSGSEIIFCFDDFTDRLYAESELQKLSEAVNQSKASIVITNKKGEIEYVNPAFLAMTGYTWEEVSGQNPRILQSGLTPPEIFKDLWGTITHGKTWTGEFHNQRKDGSLYWESVNISPIIDKQGHITHYVAVKDDASTRKSTELLLLKAKESAEDASLAKSMFLANMSHEIRTPMNGIMGFTELLLDTVKDTEQRSFLQLIQRSSQSLLMIINDILDISKVEANKVELSNTEFDLIQTVSDAVVLARGKLTDERIRIEWDPTNCPKWVLGDALRFRQVLTNLLGNAVKFTLEGKVTVTGRVLEKAESIWRLEFMVEDTGPGIAENKFDQIFEPFQQADNSITRKYGGTGLGLALSRKLVRLMGGDLRVKSELGKGSCFFFDVCFEEVLLEMKNYNPPEKTESTQLLKPLYLLLCEDNLINQKLATKLLQSMGCTVDVALNGAQGVTLVSQNKYDLILMDLQMPVLDGLSATQKLRLNGCKIPIVAMTANAMQGDREICLSAGMNDYITKPIKRQNLIDVLNKITSIC
jgi:PAS domain S-box-containing protein